MHVSVGGGRARTLDNSFNRRSSSSSVAVLGAFQDTNIWFSQLPKNKDVLGCGYGLSNDSCYVRNISCVHCMHCVSCNDDVVAIQSACCEIVASGWMKTKMLPACRLVQANCYVYSSWQSLEGWCLASKQTTHVPRGLERCPRTTCL